MANNNWGTPPHFIESARKVMGSIDCDPASNDQAQQTVKALRYFTEENSGLHYEWEGNVWLNPPYGRGLAQPFISKLVEEFEYQNINQSIVLLNTVYTSQWWRETNANNHCSAVCLPDHRIAFINPDTSEPEKGNDRDQFFAYFGDNPDLFCEEFSKYGLCLKPYRPVTFI